MEDWKNLLTSDRLHNLASGYFAEQKKNNWLIGVVLCLRDTFPAGSEPFVSAILRSSGSGKALCCL